MNARIKEIYDRAEGRYFDEGEALELIGYAETVLARLETMQAVERAEKAILDDAVAAVLARFPEYAKQYGPVADPLTRRDLCLTLRYAVFGALLHDKGYIYDKLAVWLRTILFALIKVEEAVFGQQALIAACKAHLTPADAEVVVPHVAMVLREFEINGGKPS
jgi:hypothetical protein